MFFSHMIAVPMAVEKYTLLADLKLAENTAHKEDMERRCGLGYVAYSIGALLETLGSGLFLTGMTNIYTSYLCQPTIKDAY